MNKEFEKLHNFFIILNLVYQGLSRLLELCLWNVQPKEIYALNIVENFE